MAINSEDQLFKAKIAEQTERFEDMIESMTLLVKSNVQLDADKRNLLSVAFKNTVGSRRTAWRALNSIMQKDKNE